MTREEEVRAAIDKVFPCTDGGRCYEQAIGASGFELGVKWSDEHPKNVWHDASEEPICGRDIIAVDSGGYALSGTFRRVEDNKGVYYNCFYLCDWDVVAKWAYINDLLPKGGKL